MSALFRFLAPVLKCKESRKFFVCRPCAVLSCEALRVGQAHQYSQSESRYSLLLIVNSPANPQKSQLKI